MEEKETTTEDYIEYLLANIFGGKHSDGRNASPLLMRQLRVTRRRRGGPSNTRIHSYQTTRIARRYYRARHSNGRRQAFDDTSPELNCEGAPDPGLYIFLLSCNSRLLTGSRFVIVCGRRTFHFHLRDRHIDKIQDNNVAEFFCNFTSRE